MPEALAHPLKLWADILFQDERYLGVPGWRSGESVRLPPPWPGFDSWTQRHKWVEFVVGSRPCSEGFCSGSPVFLTPQKPTLQIPIRFVNEGHRFVSFAVSVPPTKSG